MYTVSLLINQSGMPSISPFS